MTVDARELSDRFLRGVSTAAEDATLLRELLRQSAYTAAPEMPDEASYGAVLDRLTGRLPELERAVEREDEQARRLAQRFESGDRAAAIADLEAADRRVARRAFEELCERSQQACARDPELAVRLGEAALAAASALGDGDLEARAAARIANAHRVRGDFPASAAGIVNARQRLALGSGLPAARGDVALREAALLADQSRFEEALRLSRDAGRWFASAG